MSVFLITGSDTSVGKTVFTGLLGMYLSDKGFTYRLAKPFCSGGRGDIEFLGTCVDVGEAEVNYWYCHEAISPGAWELRSGGEVDFEGCLDWMERVGGERLHEGYWGGVFLVEGVGGLLAPLAKGKTVASLGQALGARLIIVAPNRVGVVNHILLTVEAALARGLSIACVVMMSEKEPDDSAVDNAELVKLHLPHIVGFNGVFDFPWLGEGAGDPSLVLANFIKAQDALSDIFEACVLPLLKQGLK